MDEEIEIHFNVQFSISKNKKYLILLENPAIRPQNKLLLPNVYSKIFSWDKRLSKLEHFVYTRYPHDPSLGSTNDIKNTRYSMVCSNRNLLIGKECDSLYNKRQEVIDYANKNRTIDFVLYGTGWNMRNIKLGLVDRILMALHSKNMISLKRSSKLPFYKGHCDDKFSLLRCSVFNFCFENISNYPGYISEKIWDSIFSGSIPVYWPSWEIPNDELPKDIYVDASKYNSISELFDYLEQISDEEIKNWRQRLKVFAKQQKKIISVSKYVETIISEVKKDLRYPHI